MTTMPTLIKQKIGKFENIRKFKTSIGILKVIKLTQPVLLSG